MPKSLYVCYFGLREPLVQTQVIPYLKEILKDGVEISLLTFEPEFKKRWTSEAIEAEREFPARPGPLCRWCDYAGICPEAPASVRSAAPDRIADPGLLVPDADEQARQLSLLGD